MSPGNPSDSENTSRHAACRIEQPETTPRLDGAREAAAEKRGIDAFARLEAPNSRADLRGRRVGAATEKLAGRADELDRCSGVGLAIEPVDRSGEYPRVPAPQRLFAARLEPNLRSGAPHTDGGLGQLHPERRRTSADARAASSTTSPTSRLVRRPPRLTMRPSIMTVSTLAGCAASTSRCAGSVQHGEIHRARVDHDEVGALARRQRADAVVDAHRARAVDRRELEHASRRELELVRARGRSRCSESPS